MGNNIKRMVAHYLMWSFCSALFASVQAKSVGLSSLQKLKKGIYTENLAPYRIEFCTPPRKEKKELLVPLAMPLDKTQCLERLLAKRKIAYEGMHSLKGYTIQVYMGGSRTAALKVHDLASTFQSTYPPELRYKQPNYTVRFGFFSDKLEAYFVYLTLVKKLPSAMVRPWTMVRPYYAH